MKVHPQEVYLHGLGKFPDYCYSLDISWSVDPAKPTYVVTGGADSVARVWTVNREKMLLEIHSELTGHQLGVNCVRFSPDGLNAIATASDDGKVVVWRPQPVVSEDGSTPGVRWLQARVLNVLDEVVGIAWSPCGNFIAAAVQREMTHIFSSLTGKLLARLDGHCNRVTGVCWDPLGQHIVSQSSDRTARVYGKKRNGTWYPKALLKEVVSSGGGKGAGIDAGDVVAAPAGAVNKWKLFISESHFSTDPTAHFFRRPEFSPDGSMVVLPGGLSDPASDDGVKFVTHLFGRRQLLTGQAPTATLTTLCSPSIAARFHPRQFIPTTPSTEPFFVYVVTTVSSFYVMRSDRTSPIAFGTDIHCTSIVDAAWSSDATVLALCSTDGYITLIRFEEGELGGVPDWSGFALPVTQVQPEQAKPVAVEVVAPGAVADAVVTTSGGDVDKKRRITPQIVCVKE